MEPCLLLLLLLFLLFPLLSWFRLFLHLLLNLILLLLRLFLCAPGDTFLPLMPPETTPTIPSQTAGWMRMGTTARMMRWI